MSGGRRLENLYAELTAKERGILVLGAWKEGKDEDRGWRTRMPQSQGREFNRYIDLMNGVNHELGLYLYGVHQEAEKLSLRLGWLGTLALWGMLNVQLGSYLVGETKEPITESEHRARVEEERAKLVPVKELGDLLTGRHEDWADDELESESVVKPKAWERVEREKVRELTRLVEEGVLQGEGQGRRLRVQAGSFYDWLEEEVPVWPESAFDFEVLPDDEAEEVARRRRERDGALKAQRHGPSLPLMYMEGWPEILRAAAEVREQPEANTLDELLELHKTILREGIEKRWRELGAAKAVIEEVAEEFDGEDPVLPRVRQALEDTEERLRGVHKGLLDYVERFELPEPGEEALAEVRELMEQTANVTVTL